MSTTGLTTNFRLKNATDFVEAVANANNIYALLGRTSKWSDEQSPPVATTSLEETASVWTDINGIKKLIASDVSLGIRDIEWKSDTVYDEYADDVDITNKNFYICVDGFYVYKCISNGNGAKSVVKPVHTTYEIPLESDGYKWKFMFQITVSKLRKFIVPDYLPIDLEITTGAPYTRPGTIDNIRVDSSGDEYPPNARISADTELQIFIEGDGDSNSSAEVNITASGSGELISVGSIVNEGSDYPYAPEKDIPVAFRQVTESGAVQTAYGIATTSPTGTLESVRLVIGGSGYETGTAKVVQSSCWGYAETDSDGKIINADIPMGREGQNFHYARAVIVTEEGTGGSLHPVLSPRDGHGSNPAAELFANYALVNLRIADRNTFIGQSDFRRVGLIESPKIFGPADSDGEYPEFTDAEGDGKYRLELSSGDNSSFIEGERIFGQTSGAIGIQSNPFNSDVLRVGIDRSIAPDINFIDGEQVVGETSGAIDTIATVTTPDIQPYEGLILYINNREVVEAQNTDQIETITLVLDYNKCS